MVKRLSVLDKYEHILSQVNAVAMERLIDPTTQVNIQQVCDDPALLAQQLTHIEMVRSISKWPKPLLEASLAVAEVWPLFGGQIFKQKPMPTLE